MTKPTPKTSRSKASKTAKKLVSKPIKASKSSQKSTRVTKATKTQKTPKAVKPKFSSTYPRSAKNPFREGSSYAVAFDVLAGHPDGLPRQQLVAEVAKATGKDAKHAAYDCAVLLSAKEDGSRHQSCRPGFWVERTNDHLILHVAASTPAGKQ